MRDLVRDVGITTDNIPFHNVGDLQKKREQSFAFQSDPQYGYLMNALFTPLDMTDYENTFVGWNEIGSGVPIDNVSLLKPVIEEPWPANHALVEAEKMEKPFQWSRSKSHRELLEYK
jgi:hypothetical protein